MLVVRVFSSLVAGAVLSLGPATGAGASALPSPGIDITATVSASVPVVSVVIGPVPDKKHQDKPPKPKPRHHKHQKPPPVPAPQPVPAPPVVQIRVPLPVPHSPGGVSSVTGSAVVANVTTRAAVQAHAGGDRAGVLAVSRRPARELANDGQVAALAAPVVYQVTGPGLPTLVQLGNISLWAYGAVFLLFMVVGLGAWVMHLRGARW